MFFCKCICRKSAPHLTDSGDFEVPSIFTYGIHMKPGEIQGDVYRMCCAVRLFPRRFETMQIRRSRPEKEGQPALKRARNCRTMKQCTNLVEMEIRIPCAMLGDFSGVRMKCCIFMKILPTGRKRGYLIGYRKRTGT